MRAVYIVLLSSVTVCCNVKRCDNVTYVICLPLEISGLKIKLSSLWPIAWFLPGRREGECEVCEVELLWKGGIHRNIR
jgi:hypothetical protein